MGLSDAQLEFEIERARDELMRRPDWTLRDSCVFVYGGHAPSPRGTCRRCGSLLVTELGS